METNRSFAVSVALTILTLVLPPSLYVGSYLTLLETGPCGIDESAGRYALYRVGRYERQAEVVFAPANWIDQKLRPSYWDDVDWLVFIHPTSSMCGT